MKILAFDKLKKSLKQTAINLNWYWIKDLPLPFNTIITDEYVDEILKYNANDVHITAKLALHIEDNIKLRFNIWTKFNIFALSASNSKIADEFFKHRYSEISDIPIRDFIKQRTYRSWIIVGKCISTKIKFYGAKLNHLLNNLLTLKIQKTKGEITFKIEINNTYYKIGTGGLHSIDKPAVFYEDETNYLIDCDVKAYYPSLIINEEITPAHLNLKAFIQFAKELKYNRTIAQKEGDIVTDKTYKIVTNAGLFGKLGFEFSPMYDLEAFVKVTISGQLFIIMLIEKLEINGFNVISVNTDGIVTKVEKTKVNEYIKLCQEWCDETKFELEYSYYKLYIRKDVNSYLAKYTNNDINGKNKNKIKLKGCFDKDKHITGIPELSKALNAPVVAQALEEYYINDIPIMDTINKVILEKDGIYKFCISQKTSKKYWFEFQSIKEGKLHTERLQKNVRFYVSNKGGALLKAEHILTIRDEANNTIDKIKRSKIIAGQLLTIFNNYKYEDNINNYDINYNYYRIRCIDIINNISTGITDKHKIKKNLGQFKLDM